MWGERDTGLTARRAIDALRCIGDCALQYDCVGVGAGVKAETNRLIDEGLMPDNITLVPWNAGAEVLRPDHRIIPGDSNSPKNKDVYANLKAQAWWELRRRFERTYRAINDPEFTSWILERGATVL
jgi:phage terminase large subunit